MKILVKKFLFIILSIQFMLIIILMPNTSKAVYNQQILVANKENKNGIELFPESYQVELNRLIEDTSHFNWKFRPFYTDIDWNELTSETNENKCLRNTIWMERPIEWRCKCGKHGDKGYVCASKDIVNYYLDPRNFLTEKTIFQFLDLSNTTVVSQKEIEEAVKGTYLSGKVNGESYAKIIFDASKESGENAFSIIVRIFQELGKGKELPYMISGNDPDYPGVYNFFNYGATDGEGNLKRGLEYAKEKGWTTPRKALIEGANLISGTYTKAGQLNKYLYKFDVVGKNKNDLYTHQYMTNVEDPNSQANSLHNTYNNSGLIDKELTFVIPVYKNMPSFIKKPHNEGLNSNLYYVASNYDGVNWRNSPNGEIKGTLVKDTVVTMLQTNVPNVKTPNGYPWAKIMQNGDIGYMSMEYLRPVNRKKDEYKIPEGEEKFLGKNKDDGMVSYTVQMQDIGWTGWENDRRETWSNKQK